MLLVTFLKVKTKQNVSPLPKCMIIANLKINYRVSPADTWQWLSWYRAERGHSQVPHRSGRLSLSASILRSSSALPHDIVPRQQYILK